MALGKLNKRLEKFTFSGARSQGPEVREGGEVKRGRKSRAGCAGLSNCDGVSRQFQNRMVGTPHCICDTVQMETGPPVSYVGSKMSNKPSLPQVQFACPDCHNSMRIAARSIGKAVTCPFCKKLIVVPPPSSPPPVPDQPLETGFDFIQQPQIQRNPPPPNPPMASNSISPQQVAILICAIIGMMGTFMPWVSMPIVGSISGTAGDGWITFALFSVSLILAFASPSTRVWSLVPAILASGIAGWKIGEFANLKQETLNEIGNDPFGLGNAMVQTIRIEAGLYLILLAGIVLACLAVFLRENSPKRRGRPTYSKYLHR